VILVGVLAAAAAIHFRPREAPLILDEAGLLDASEQTYVSEYHGYLAEDHDIDYRVVTTRSDVAVLEQAVSLYDELGVGSRSKWGRGLLLVINPETNRVRLEVGYALEGTFPDAFVTYVEQRQMVPFFAGGRVSDGILATTELIVDRAQRASEHDGPDADEVWVMGSGGAGAETTARIGAGFESPTNATGHDDKVSALTDSPEETLSAYFDAMDARNGSPQLAIYSPETRVMLRERTITPAQMDMVVRTYRACSAEPVRYSDDGRHAVIRYPPAQRHCAPYFFVKENDRWMLDLAFMNQAIRFGRTNAWHRSKTGLGNYVFAFEDWTFDRHGFPLE